MARVQLVLVFLIGTSFPLIAMGVQPSAAGGRVVPAAADLVAESTEPVSMGYAEAEAGLGCCPVATECCPSWTVEVGAIFLGRDRPDARPAVEVQPYGQSRIFSMTESDLGTAAGPDVTLTRCLGSCWDVEARYFQIDGWNDTHTFTGTYPTYVTAYGNVFALDTPSLGYSSRLYNIEVNLRWKAIERMPLLVGFRTLGLDETFQITTPGAPPTSLARTTTNNALYGMQIGTDAVLWDRCGRFRLESPLKAGIYGNRAHQRTIFAAAGTQIDRRTDGVPSFVGEIGLIGSFQLNKCWSVRAGYEVMWITNVALAPDQASTIQFATSTPTGHLYDQGIVCYYGATASLERKF